jgi:hypothetical protein
MRILMKRIVLLSVLGMMVSVAGAHADDPMDSKLHSAVSSKVQQDHVSDKTSGKIGAPPAGAGSAVSSPNAATSHPTQVNDLKKRKKKHPPSSTGQLLQKR